MAIDLEAMGIGGKSSIFQVSWKLLQGFLILVLFNSLLSLVWELGTSIILLWFCSVAAVVAEVRQRVSNMAGVMKKEVRIVASPHRICPLGDYTDHQEILKGKFGVPHLSTPPVTNTSVPGSQGTAIIAPKPIRATPDLVTGLEDLSWPWTWSLN
ncbi:hypothetical protein HN873_060637 [Arachis hypogaea]